MMSNYTRLSRLTIPWVDTLSKIAFVTKCKEGRITLRDCYVYFTQLLAIYTALEKRLKEADLHDQLSGKYNEFLDRKEKLEADLEMLSAKLTISDREARIVDSAQKYIECLNKITLNENGKKEILIHFLIRILIDHVWAGHYKLIRESLKRLANNEILFYQFKQVRFDNFSGWINNQSLDLVKLEEQAKSCFCLQHAILNSLIKSTFLQFFTLKNVVKTTSAVVVSSLVLYRFIH